MSVAFAAASRGRLSARAFALVGTSLGCSLLLPANALAQNVSYNGNSDYTLTQTDPINGGPRAVDITTSGGAINLNLPTVNTANSGTTLGAGIAGNNTGTGGVSITDGTVTATGTGQTYGVDARTTTGDIVINSGTVTSNSNATSRGIYAITGSGNITITAGETDGGTRGIYTGFNGNSDGPDVTTITSQNVTANGTTSTNAIVGQGNTVSITSGTASNTNAAAYQGVTILANAGTGGATIVAGTTSALGQNQAAIQAFSDGAVSITSGTVNTTQSSDGITVESGTTIGIDSSSVTTLGDGARGIVLGGADGGGSLNGGTDGIPYTSATITSGTISTAGANSYGIYVTPTFDATTGATASGTTSISSGAITTTGAGATGIYVAPIGNGVFSGATTIDSTGALTTSGTNASGISVVNGSGALSITNSGTITTSGAGSSAIVVTPVSGSTAPITIDGGTIRVTGSTQPAINVSSAGIAGPVTVSVADMISSGAAVDARSAGAVSITGGTVQVTGSGAFGLNAISSGSSATVASTSLSVNDGRGIFAEGATDTNVTSGNLTTTGADYDYALLAQNGPATGVTPGTVTVVSNTLTSDAGGILTYSPAGDIAITAGTTSSAGNVSNAILANTTTGAITIDADTTSASGLNSHAIQANTTTGDIAITAKTATTTGAYDQNSDNGSDAIFASTTSTGTGKITINAGTTSATAQYASAIFATGGGAVSITSGTASASGDGTDVIGGVSGTSDVSITAGQTSATGTGSDAIGAAAANGNVTINAGATSASAGNAISVTAGGLASVTAASADGHGDGGAGVSVTGGTGVTLAITEASSNGSATTVNGTSHPADAINAQTTAGAINATVGSASATGAGSDAVNLATNGTGAITLNATTTSSTGGSAIMAEGGGAVTVTSGTATVGGTTGDGVYAYSSGGGAVSVTSGTATQTATTAHGTYNVAGISRATGGTVTIASGTSSALGLKSTAVYGSADGDVTITSGSATSLAGSAIDAISTNGVASITATSAVGADRGVYAYAGTGVVLDIGSASSTAASNAADTEIGARGDAIDAAAVNGSILATIGSATATGAGSDAVRLVADGTGGAVTATITGQLSSASGNGLFIDPPGAVTVNIGSGASVSGAIAGINVTGGTNTITNAGTVSSTAGPGILASGTTNLVDSGTISGANGVAVQLGATDDTVTLQTGAAITGRIVGGGGTDAAILSGTGTTPSAAQTVAGFTGFDSLTVQSGYWTAQAANASSFNSATIDGGASLEVANGAAGITGVTAPTIVDNGTLVVASSAASAGSTFGSTVVSGSGNVAFTGAGTATLDGTNSIATTGTISVDGGSTLLVTGTQGGTVVAGTGGTLVVGNGGTTGALTGSVVDNGTLVVDRSDSFTFTGALTGTGNLVKQGAGELVFGSNYDFTGTTTIDQGAIKLATPVATTSTIDLEGSGELDFSGTNQQIAQLSGSSSTASINIAGGSLTVDQAGTTSFAGSITGNGSLTKTGSGLLDLTGVSTYTGPTTVSGGNLAVNGSISSPVTVDAGGTLSGTGSVGTVTIGSGGVYAPGNAVAVQTAGASTHALFGVRAAAAAGTSIGTQTVNGNVTFAAGSTYQVQADAAGDASRIAATGTATVNGGTVQVLAASGTYARLTDYTILTAAGGVTGKFAGVTSNMAFLSPLLSYGADTVTLTLARNDLAFGAVATSARELSVANAIAARGTGDTIYNAVLFDSAPAARQTFNQLSGEIHASLPSELADAGRRVREAVLDHLTPEEGLGVWGQGLQSYASSRPQAGIDEIDANRTGAVGGVDYAHDGITLGLLGGYLDDEVNVAAAGSSAQIHMTFAGATARYDRDALSLRVGGTYAWQNINTTRVITAPGLAETVYADPHANSAQVFGELGYAFTRGAVTLTPFVGDAFNWTRIKRFSEGGGVAALSVARDSRTTDFVSAGIHMTGTAPVSANIALLPKITVSYEHGFGDLNGASVAQIGGTGPSFAVTGARLGRDTLNVDTGFDLLFGKKFSVGASGFASTSSQWSDYGVKASIGIRF